MVVIQPLLQLGQPVDPQPYTVANLVNLLVLNISPQPNHVAITTLIVVSLPLLQLSQHFDPQHNTVVT